jgi:hypothetical protein
LTKLILNIVFCFLAITLSAQKKPATNAVRKEWKSQHDKVGYDKYKDYNGPKPGGYRSPVDMSSGSYGSSSSSPNSYNYKPYQGKSYTPRQITQGQQVPPNYHRGNKKGTIKRDPNIVQPEPAEIPDEGYSDEEQAQQAQYQPNTPSASYDRNEVGTDFWKILGIIVLILLVIFILYLILSNIKPGEKTIPFTPLEENMNPETISKTELEMRLEEAEQEGNYKECVRIYFLFAMKELLSRQLLFWKKEKTNMHYIIEMQGKPGLEPFEKIVAQYDIVWYGDYEIDKEAYYSMLPTLNSSYKALEQL